MCTVVFPEIMFRRSRLIKTLGSSIYLKSPHYRFRILIPNSIPNGDYQIHFLTATCESNRLSIVFEAAHKIKISEAI